MPRGVDVSKYQGFPDWNAVAGDGIDFAIVSTGDGRGTSPGYIERAKGAQDAGLQVSLYHYVRFGVPSSEQAQVMRARWSDALSGGLRPDRYWIDVEDTETSPAGGGSATSRGAWLWTLVASLEDEIPLGIYTARWYWPDYMGNTTMFNYLPLWTAAYTTTEPPEDGQPAMYGGWLRCAIWQWTSSGSVAGIAGSVDMNVSEFAESGGDSDMGMTPEEQADYENTKANVSYLLDMVVRNGIWRDGVIGGEKVGGQEAYEWVRNDMASRGVSLYLHDQELYDDTHEHGDGGSGGGGGGPHVHDDYSVTTHTHDAETGPGKQ